MNEFSHFNEHGMAKMVDVSQKESTTRTAIAQSCVKLNKETFIKVKEGKMKKGDVLSVAQVAGIMAAKKTAENIPMCHPIFITGADLDFSLIDEKNEIIIRSTIRCKGETGVEMEALHSVSVAALTIYDMCKSMQKDILIKNIELLEKTGGKSGHYKKEQEKTQWEK